MNDHTTVPDPAAGVLAGEAGPIPAFGPVARDEAGRVLMTDAEWAARRDAALRSLAVLDALPDDDPPGVAAEVFRAIDEGRPHRRQFEGLY